jgi:integrase
VPLDAELIAMLRHFRGTARRPDDGALVFVDINGAQLVPQGAPRASWQRAVASARLAPPPPRFHDLRHTFATHALASGLSAHAVARLLGHADPGLVWRRYGHALPSELADAGERLRRWRADHISEFGP